MKDKKFSKVNSLILHFLAAYNTGPTRVNRALKLHETSDYWQLYSLPKDTKNYIPYYLSSAIILQNPEKYGFKIPKNNPLKYDEVKIERVQI